jgi:hypothetical protein
VSYVAGEVHSDRPQGVCPVLSIFARCLNDAFRTDDTTRTELLEPLILPLVGTLSSHEVERAREQYFVRTALGVFAPISIEANSTLIRMFGFSTLADQARLLAETLRVDPTINTIQYVVRDAGQIANALSGTPAASNAYGIGLTAKKVARIANGPYSVWGGIGNFIDRVASDAAEAANVGIYAHATDFIAYSARLTDTARLAVLRQATAALQDAINIRHTSANI